MLKSLMSRDEKRSSVETPGKRLSIVSTSAQTHIRIFLNITSIWKQFYEKLSEHLMIPLLRLYYRNMRKYFFLYFFTFFLFFFSYIIESFQQNSFLQTYSIPHNLNEHLSMQFTTKRNAMSAEIFH